MSISNSSVIVKDLIASSLFSEEYPNAKHNTVPEKGKEVLKPQKNIFTRTVCHLPHALY